MTRRHPPDGYRDPVVRRLFDPHLDIRWRSRDALDHHLRDGWRRGDDPCPLFSTRFYLTQYPDVAAAGVCPLVHYSRHGWREDRRPHPLFDPVWYRTECDDLDHSDTPPLVHFLDTGGSEGRSPHAWFDATAYLSASPDIAAAGINPLLHYLTAGWRQGRRPHPDFDPAYYLASNPDVARHGLEPLTHFVLRGRHEGRLPSPSYDLRFLLEASGCEPMHTKRATNRRPPAVGIGVGRSRSRAHAATARSQVPRQRHRADIDIEALRPSITGPTPDLPPGPPPRVLAIGVVLADEVHTAADTAQRLAESPRVAVQQRWYQLGQPRRQHLRSQLDHVPIVARRADRAPKFVLLDALLTSFDRDAYDYLVIVDDDVVLPHGFVDAFFAAQARMGFALAQPARTANSCSAHPIVEQHPGLVARETLFVEQGPLVSIRRCAFDAVVPFDLRSPMGWGYESVWSARLTARGQSMGVIDSTPVDHSVRPTAALYSHAHADRHSTELLAHHSHRPLAECMRVVRAVDTWPAT